MTDFTFHTKFLHTLARHHPGEEGRRARQVFRRVSAKRGRRKQQKAFRRAWRDFWRWFYDPKRFCWSDFAERDLFSAALFIAK